MIKEFLQGRSFNHPLHPMLVHLPIGLWVGSFILDIVYLAGGSPAVAAASFYCMLLGICGALLAVLPGLADYLEIRSETVAKRIATAHLVLNLLIATLYVANLLIRYQAGGGATPTSVSAVQFVLSVVGIVFLGGSGYLGGLLVYDHAVGFRPQERDRRDKDKKEDFREAA